MVQTINYYKEVFKEGENEIDRMLKELGVNPKDYVLKPINIPSKGPENKFDGTYVKIDDEIRKLVKEKGIDAFRFGGPVGIQESLNELNKIILPNPPDVGSIKPNDLDTLMKEVGISPVGSEGAEAIILYMAERGAFTPATRAATILGRINKAKKQIKELEKAKQLYIRTNKATQVSRYKAHIDNQFNKKIKLLEKEIKEAPKMYDDFGLDLKKLDIDIGLEAGGPVSIDNMLAAL